MALCFGRLLLNLHAFAFTVFLWATNIMSPLFWITLKQDEDDEGEDEELEEEEREKPRCVYAWLVCTPLIWGGGNCRKILMDVPLMQIRVIVLLYTSLRSDS